ncbi:MAG: hypothetical protein JJV90_01425 [Spiroplasma sp.]|nr:hypothetical protein [Mycoplasmatales bacterium]
MKKFLAIVVSILLITTGCTQDHSAIVESAEFDVQFGTLDNDNQVASFIVSGWPTDEEFEQIDTIIISSMSNQNLVDGKYLVGVHSILQDAESDPAFGFLEYEDGEIILNATKNLTEEEYLNLSLERK